MKLTLALGFDILHVSVFVYVHLFKCLSVCLCVSVLSGELQGANYPAGFI